MGSSPNPPRGAPDAQLLQEVSLSLGLQLPGGATGNKGRMGQAWSELGGMWLAGGLDDKKAGNSLL